MVLIIIGVASTDYIITGKSDTSHHILNINDLSVTGNGETIGGTIYARDKFR